MAVDRRDPADDTDMQPAGDAADREAAAPSIRYCDESTDDQIPSHACCLRLLECVASNIRISVEKQSSAQNEKRAPFGARFFSRNDNRTTQ
jgi:hypothetical protein